jgi:hypothetical protein
MKWQSLYLVLVFGLVLILANHWLYPAANGNDLYPRWYGTQVLLHGGDPYGRQVTEESERHNYGHVLAGYEIQGHRDQERFAYPLYVAFLLAPLTALDFGAARHLLWLFLVGATFISVFVWARAMNWRPPQVVLALLATLVVFSPVCRRGLVLTQLALLLAFILAAAAWSAVNGYLLSAGALLAVATIKPQMALLPVIWFLLWAVTRLRERGRLIAGFALVLGLLMALSLAILPTWPREFLHGLSEYSAYTSAPSAFDAMFGKRLSPFLTWPLLGALAVAMWRNRQAAPGSLNFALVLVLILGATAWLMPAMFDPFNQILMLPGICLLGTYFQGKHARRHTALSAQAS